MAFRARLQQARARARTFMKDPARRKARRVAGWLGGAAALYGAGRLTRGHALRVGMRARKRVYSRRIARMSMGRRTAARMHVLRLEKRGHALRGWGHIAALIGGYHALRRRRPAA
jgi:hypothetical protein